MLQAVSYGFMNDWNRAISNSDSFPFILWDLCMMKKEKWKKIDDADLETYFAWIM